MFVIPAENHLGALQFSSASEPTARWSQSMTALNRRVFCSAVSRVAALYARRAAVRLWDAAQPLTDEDLNDLLDATNIRVTVCEGSNLLERANELVASTRGGGGDGLAGERSPPRHRNYDL
ncbi:viral protein 22 [Leporid alphaherpesvirus 4]|uniref:Tegument protein VP22 n=1 Tax=Leporid alphaherpesvirus 4 TaxID=481315 RepID=J9QYQ0_9ALPH|nr:viral protein 22 [Leporid alphaherpesvirus 4]AFR32493.1 viral protein 22 [Leporid alphaherpesvirus 4]